MFIFFLMVGASYVIWGFIFRTVNLKFPDSRAADALLYVH